MLTRLSKMYITKLTFNSLHNVFSSFLSYTISKLIKKTVVWGFPQTISIEVSSLCNLHCPECTRGQNNLNRNSGLMEMSLYTKIIDDISLKSFGVLLYFQGEPFLNHQLPEMVKYAHEKKLFIITSTNGHFLTAQNCKSIVEAGIDKIIISADGITQETYEEYRKGGSLEIVKQGIINLCNARKESKGKTPLIVVQFLVNAFNEAEMPKAENVFKKLGADKVVFKSMQISDYEGYERFLPTNSIYSRYVKKGKGYILKNSKPNVCKRLWQTSVVTFDGNVVPCCFDKTANYVLGNIRNQSFAEIWNGSEYQKFRERVLNEANKISICTTCGEGEKIFV